MSTLNTFGFNVRRKRYQDATIPSNSKQNKTISSTNESASPTLAFEAPVTSSLLPTKPSVTCSLKLKSPTKNSKSKTSKQQSLHKDPKQATLLPFFSKQQPTNIPVLPSPQPSMIPQQPTCATSSQQEDENEVCLVRRRFSAVDLLPILVETYGSEYSDDDSDMDQQRPDAMVLLHVKPSKAIYSTLSDETEDNLQERPRRRRRSEKDDQATKRSCPELHLHIDSFLDEFDSQQEDDDRVKMVYHCLSTNQVNSLLLDIANEYLAFDDNAWCASYLG